MLQTLRLCRSGAAVVLAAALLNMTSFSTLRAQQQTGPAAEQAVAAEVQIELENPHLGYTFVGEGGIRYFVTQVRLSNRTAEPVSAEISDFGLTADGVAVAPDMEFSRLTGYEFRVAGKTYRFRDLPRTTTLKVDPRSTGGAWIIFTGLTRTPDVPQLDLRVTIGGAAYHIDVNDHCNRLLQLTTLRIGPRDSLGLLRIDGWLNTINAGTVVKSIEELSAAGLSRVVIGFGAEAQKLDPPLGSWLEQTADGVQTSQTYAMFPAVVSTVRELHVARIPGMRQDTPSGHVHDSLASAVEAALASAYRGLSPAEIATEIEQGHPLAQAAALVNGGADLPQEYLPLLLERAESDDPLLRRGGLIALSGSGDDEAIRRLREQARSADPAVSVLALECLAASRFAGAHQVLRQLLEQPLAADKEEVIRIIARYPRPDWADYLADLVLGSSGSASTEAQREVVLALGRIGHPRLREVLGRALESSDGQLQQAAFGLLLVQQDPESQQLALDHALQQVAQTPPTTAMLQLFDRVRDPRIPSLLLRHLDNSELNRSALINTLARIGPAEIDDVLADRYDSFNPSEQAAVLSNLTHLRSPRLLPLARAGLSSEQHPVFTAAVHALGLQTDAGSVEALAARLSEETEIGRITTIAKALEEVGLWEAGRALDAARKASSGDKRRVIARHLHSLQMRSPGGQYLQIAERHAQEEEHQKAVDYYNLAIKRDPDMAPAYSGRGHAHLKLEDYERAEADFRRCIELDDENGLAVAGLGITLAIAGNTDEAIRIVQEAAPRFAEDLLFAYNAACVYGRVLERIASEPATDQSGPRVQQLQKAALERLSRSIELGFPDLDWMRRDPDLASLRHLEEFQQLATPDPDGDQTPQQQQRPGPPGPRPPRPPQPGEQ